ncbi:unnamed protein product [Bursaphelenchus xylophilus]|uniref:(pine wood nematode) hypothetical protein n=1 Tax=Bursaphelenchus xylophilus TaxID=6326 RepID=A0A1I7RSL4_BURXY|nr:unnamed protein product [Bursaphelenchus xylophilus]CAG9122879.1 unnamed protein product [Bursaphelenchus xylophilus]
MPSVQDNNPEVANTARSPTASEDVCTAKVPKSGDKETNTNTDASADTHTLREPTEQERKQAPNCTPVQEFSFTGGYGIQEFDYSAMIKPKVHAFDPATEEARKREERKKRREKRRNSKTG